MESDINPQSGFRLPLLKRDDLDDVGKQAYDKAVTPGRSIAGLQASNFMLERRFRTYAASLDICAPRRALPPGSVKSPSWWLRGKWTVRCSGPCTKVSH
jgi:hypothetical protein